MIMTEREIALMPEYISSIDFREVQAVQIRRVILEPKSGKLTLSFYDKYIPTMIGPNAKTHGMIGSGWWLVKTKNNQIEFKSDLEFRSEFRPIY